MVKKGLKPKIQPLVPLKKPRTNREPSFMNTPEFMAQTPAFRSRMPALEPKTGARSHNAEPRILDFSEIPTDKSNYTVYLVVGAIALGVFLLNKEKDN